MLQVPFIRENKENVIKQLAVRNIDATKMIEDVISLDEDRRQTQTLLDNALAESNTLSKEIGNLYKSGKTAEANILKERTTELKETTKELNEKLNEKVEALNQLLYKIPNVPHISVPKGSAEDDNEIVFSEGVIPTLDKEALPHWELADRKSTRLNSSHVRISYAVFCL